MAKLALMGAALIVLTPIWLQVIAALAYGPTPAAWGTLRLVALAGGAGIIAVAALYLRIWIGLLKYLARRD